MQRLFQEYQTLEQLQLYNMIKVKGHSDLVRDPYSKAIINTDNKAYDAAIERRRLAKKKQNEFNELKQEVNELKDLIQDGRIITSIIPDVESVNYGRGVGYEVIEHIPPQEIGEISATSIREQMRKDGKL